MNAKDNQTSSDSFFKTGREVPSEKFKKRPDKKKRAAGFGDEEASLSLSLSLRVSVTPLGICNCAAPSKEVDSCTTGYSFGSTLGLPCSSQEVEQQRTRRMSRGRFAGSLTSPRFDVVVDMGNPFLNRTVDGFLTVGTVAATRVAAAETHHYLRKGSLSKHSLEESLKKMGKEGAIWGTAAGVYVGVEYGMERIRDKSDWKNALLGGAITGALMSIALKNSRDKVFEDALLGGAVATAAKFLNSID